MGEIVELFGTVEILVNCAGVTRDSNMKKMTAEQWDALIDTKLSSVFYVTQPILNLKKSVDRSILVAGS